VSKQFERKAFGQGDETNCFENIGTENEVCMYDFMKILFRRNGEYLTKTFMPQFNQPLVKLAAFTIIECFLQK